MNNKNENNIAEPLEKDKFNTFLSGDISIRELKIYSLLVESRFQYIVETISKLTHRNPDWFDYGNEQDYGNKKGYFDTEQYSNNISYSGAFVNSKEHIFTKYDRSFPTIWFTENFENKLQNEISIYIETENTKNIAKKSNEEDSNKKLQFIQNLIKAKLTDEELCFVKFVPAIEVNQNFNALKKEKQINISETIKYFKNLGVDIRTLYIDYKREEKENAKEFPEWLNANKNSFKIQATKPKIK